MREHVRHIMDDLARPTPVSGSLRVPATDALPDAGLELARHAIRLARVAAALHLHESARRMSGDVAAGTMKEPTP